MSNSSKIGWTHGTWNPVTGCTKESPGCKNCYAARMAERLRRMGQAKYAQGFEVTLHPECLDEPRWWRKPRLVFVCSMGDLFHPDVPSAFIRQVFDVMRATPQHTYQVLTKRPERMALFAKTIEWPDNVWAGTTIEHNDYAGRADFLCQVPAPVRFVSAEPLLGDLIDLELDGIDWVIAGGESGPNWRPMELEWVRNLRDYCVSDCVAFFFKQYAGFQPKSLGRELDGQVWDQVPHPEEAYRAPGVMA